MYDIETGLDEAELRLREALDELDDVLGQLVYKGGTYTQLEIDISTIADDVEDALDGIQNARLLIPE